MELWIWATLLLAIGFGLGVMEIFFPSAGILGFLCACSIISSIVVAFMESTPMGVTFSILAFLGLPAIIVMAFKVWPQTPMGKRALLDVPTSEDVLPDDPERDYYQTLLGKIGKTKSKMLPSGVIVVDGRSINAASEGIPIESGQSVRIIQIRGKKAIVRPVTDDVPTPEATDPLRRPIDSIAEDPFNQPPTS